MMPRFAPTLRKQDMPRERPNTVLMLPTQRMAPGGWAREEERISVLSFNAHGHQAPLMGTDRLHPSSFQKLERIPRKDSQRIPIFPHPLTLRRGSAKSVLAQASTMEAEVSKDWPSPCCDLLNTSSLRDPPMFGWICHFRISQMFPFISCWRKLGTLDPALLSQRVPFQQSC